jgi:hypothetical protein
MVVKFVLSFGDERFEYKSRASDRPGAAVGWLQ